MTEVYFQLCYRSILWTYPVFACICPQYWNSEAIYLRELGHLHIQLKQPEKAIELYQQAKSKFEFIGQNDNVSEMNKLITTANSIIADNL